jgi:ribose-phosphate pyrophosphokinase
MVIFGGSTSLSLAKRITEILNVPLGNASVQPHPNGESMVKIETDVRQRDVFIVQSVCRKWLPNGGIPFTGVNDSLMELFVFIDALARSSAYRITAVMPHFGYARQDRKAAGRTPISAKILATCLEEIGCDRVLTMDLHAEQIQGFFSHETKLDHLNAGKVLTQHIRSLSLDNAVVLSPDVGNLKKADKYRKGLPDDVEIAVIDKRRNKNGDVIGVRLIGEVEGKSVIMFDDIISTAGTAVTAIEIALKHGAKEFYVVATHGEFVGRAIERLRAIPQIKQICITDSIPAVPQMEALPMKVLSIDELFADAISRIHNSQSISELLGEFG